MLSSIIFTNMNVCIQKIFILGVSKRERGRERIDFTVYSYSAILTSYTPAKTKLCTINIKKYNQQNQQGSKIEPDTLKLRTK